MSHREYIDNIIQSDSIEKMVMLKDVLIDAIDYIAVTNQEEYHNIEDKLFEIVDGRTIDYQKALSLINSMKPFGMKWSFEDTERIRNKNGFTDIRPVDFFLVMNSAYNDFNEIFGEDIQMYADYSDLFINDEDAVNNKIDIYYDMIPRKQ